jgi:hypothetical protein
MNWLILAEADSTDSGLKIVGLILAAVVPFVSVYTAQFISRQQRKRELVLDVFTEIRTDVFSISHDVIHFASFAMSHIGLPHQEFSDRKFAMLLPAAEKCQRLRSRELTVELLLGKKGNRLCQLMGDYAMFSTGIFEKNNVEKEQLTTSSKFSVDIDQEMRKLWKSVAEDD